MYHIPTAYLILGLLYIFLPFVVWLVLKQQKSLTTLLWTLGGGLLAVGMLLIAVREIVPPWVSYPVANFFAWVGILMQAMALRRALQQTWRNEVLVVLVLFWLLIFEYFRQVMQNSELRFAWAIMFFVGVFCYIAYLAWHIAKVHELKSVRWLSAVYALAAYMLFIRVCRVLLDVTEPDAVAQGFDSVLTVISGLLISVVGSFTFVSMFLERAAKNEIQATELRVRQEETHRLSEQIAQLERQRTLGVMSYSFAHELSQPITSILMDTQTIKSRLALVPVNLNDISRSVDDVERSAAHTADLIGRIRNFISPSQGDYSLVDLKVLVREVRFLLAHDIRTLNVSFEWDFDSADCIAHGDKVQLSQIVLNVYRNAIQAMAAGEVRKIFVSLAHEEKRVVMRVHDSGPGLSDDMKDHVGQPFVTTKSDGLGVGLSISKRIAEMHSGSLTITNAVGGGALVELSLPAHLH
jgi:C4-dicarboxylate-specific signal transduction histidine kinase